MSYDQLQYTTNYIRKSIKIINEMTRVLRANKKYKIAEYKIEMSNKLRIALKDESVENLWTLGCWAGFYSRCKDEAIICEVGIDPNFE